MVINRIRFLPYLSERDPIRGETRNCRVLLSPKIWEVDKWRRTRKRTRRESPSNHLNVCSASVNSHISSTFGMYRVRPHPISSSSLKNLWEDLELQTQVSVSVTRTHLDRMILSTSPLENYPRSNDPNYLRIPLDNTRKQRERNSKSFK